MFDSSISAFNINSISLLSQIKTRQMKYIDYTFLFSRRVYEYFLSDKYLMYRLLYCYQHDYPASFDIDTEIGFETYFNKVTNSGCFSCI